MQLQQQTAIPCTSAVLCTICGEKLPFPFANTGDETMDEIVYQIWLQTPCGTCHTRPEDMGWD